jgi:hypothetical protein
MTTVGRRRVITYDHRRRCWRPVEILGVDRFREKAVPKVVHYLQEYKFRKGIEGHFVHSR